MPSPENASMSQSTNLVSRIRVVGLLVDEKHLKLTYQQNKIESWRWRSYKWQLWMMSEIQTPRNYCHQQIRFDRTASGSSLDDVQHLNHTIKPRENPYELIPKSLEGYPNNLELDYHPKHTKCKWRQVKAVSLPISNLWRSGTQIAWKSNPCDRASS